MASEELGSLLAEQVGRGSGRAWTAWLRGVPGTRLEGKDVAAGHHRIATLLVKAWPGCLVESPGSERDREALVSDIARLVACLPRHPSAARATAPISGASLQGLLNRYLLDQRLRHQDLAEQLSQRLNEDPALQPLLEGAGDGPLEAWHVQRAASGAGLDLDRPAYYLLVRAFAAASGHDPGALFSLPFAAPAQAQEWGAYLQIQLQSLPSGDVAESVGVFLELARELAGRVVTRRLSRRPDRYAEFETTEGVTVVQTGDTSFEVMLRLKPRLEPPPSSVYGPVFLLLSEYSRQVRLAWSLHPLNLDLLRGGEQPSEAVFVVHAGIRPREGHPQVPTSPTGIGFTCEAHAHARACDVRLVWEPGPAVLGPGPDAAPVRLCQGSDGQLHGVLAFQSHIYFGDVARFEESNGRGGQRCVEIAAAKPRDTFLRVELATSLLHRRRFREALQLAQTAVAVDARHPTAWAIESVCYANLARTFPSASGDAAASQLDTVARYYHRAICAARLALDADPTQEDAFDACGCLHLLRGLDCFRWYDGDLVRDLGASPNPVRLLLLNSGFAWAFEDPGSDISALLKRAAMADLVEAQRYFDRGLDSSATKSRSFFWRLVAEALLGAITRSSEMRKSRLLGRIFVELGWVTHQDDGAAVLETLGRKIEEYDAGLLLERYLPDVQFAYAVAYWDFNDPGEETARHARTHLERALTLAAELASSGGPAQVMRCWGYLEDLSGFVEGVRTAQSRIDLWASSGTHVPLFPLYLGSAFSRSFDDLLGSLAAP